MALWLASAQGNSLQVVSRQLQFPFSLHLMDGVSKLGIIGFLFDVVEDKATERRRFLAISVCSLCRDGETIAKDDAPVLVADSYSQLLDICKLALEFLFDNECWLEQQMERLLVCVDNELKAFISKNAIEGLLDDVD